MSDQPITQPGWLNDQGKNPHQRLDIFSDLWRDHQEWVEGVKATLVKLETLGAPSIDESDSIVFSMQEAQNVLASYPAKINARQNELIAHRLNASEHEDTMAVIEAEAMMEAEGSNEGKRKAALLLAVSKDVDYCAARVAKREAERQKMIKEALITQLEGEEKVALYIIRNLRARLENLTARISLVLGE